MWHRQFSAFWQLMRAQMRISVTLVLTESPQTKRRHFAIRTLVQGGKEPAG